MKKRCLIPCTLSLLITLMHIIGWQISMDYGSSVHQSHFFQSIGVLEVWQCILIGIVEWPALTWLFYTFFSYLEKRTKTSLVQANSRYLWLLSFLMLFGVWLLFLWGCYPGYYNYDIGNQIPQFMYEEVPYNSHHPLLHTLISGSIISLGYNLYSANLSFGVFLYNAFQMMVCALCLSYSVQYIYKRSLNKVLTAFAFLFYALCPPIVMHAMSTTKDVLCHSFLLFASIRFIEMFENIENGKIVKKVDWFILGGSFVLACLLRNNIIYAVVAFSFFSLLIIKKERKRQILLYVGILVAYFAIDKGLVLALDATPGSVGEALCVPYQQIARLYIEEGKSAFTEAEYHLLEVVIPPEALNCYDPVLADHVKSNISPGLPIIMDNKMEYLKLWVRKGFQYPKIYVESFLYNTYQAWYPGTLIIEGRGPRYFGTGIDWTEEGVVPHSQALSDFYKTFGTNSYADYPFVRLFYSIGAMFWVTLITWFYGIWKKDNTIIATFLFVLLVCGTNFCGPISLVRYYLILFYLFPVCLGMMLPKHTTVA